VLLMEQQYSPVVDLEMLQLNVSRYRGELHSIHLSQVRTNRTKLNHIHSTEADLASVYDILQSMHASIARDIADLEVLLVQSGHHRTAVRQSVEHDTAVSEMNTLSCKENEVLNMFAKGYSYNEVADLLGCKLATIQTHAKRIYKKLHVHSRSEAVFEARQLE